MKKVAVVVVTYNRIVLLKECLEALEKQSYPCDILVVDNASTDGTEEYIRTIKNKCKNLYYKNTGANIGGAGGFNFGMRWAVKDRYEYVWVMDDDCIAQPITLEKFIDTDSNLGGNYGFLSSKVLWKDNNICTMNIQRETMFSNVKSFNKPLCNIVMASFVSLFIPVRVIKEIGLPIKEFFIWTDDWEYTRRISRKYPCYLVNDSIVVHKSLSNLGANIANDSIDRLNRYFYLYRNDVYLYKREGIKGFLYEVIRLSLHIFRIFMNGKNNKFKRLKYVFNGTKAGLKFNPKIEYVEYD